MKSLISTIVDRLVRLAKFPKLDPLSFVPNGEETGHLNWLDRYPDEKPRAFEEIPTVEEKGYDVSKIHQFYMRNYHKHGFVSKELMEDSSWLVHLYRFEDFRTVYSNDGPYPKRGSRRALGEYRFGRRDFYDSIGLGAGESYEWDNLRDVMKEGITEDIQHSFKKSLDDVAEKLMKVFHMKSEMDVTVELLPWLFRWTFESVGVIALNRKLDTLDDFRNEKGDKLVEAARISNESLALMETDRAHYETHYRNLAPAQDYLYSVIAKYAEEIASDPDAKCVLKTLLEKEKYSKKNAIIMILDIFLEALQKVPLTVLMALYHLSRNPDVKHDAITECFLHYNKRPKSPPFTLPPCTYQIVWETLRLSPPIIGNRRVLQKDLTLGGFLVPIGTKVILHQQVACLLESNFEDPLRFSPARHPTHRHRQLQYVFGGSGSGWACFGESFALHQMALVLSKILTQFQFTYDGQDVSIINRPHNEPKSPLYFKFESLFV